MNGDFIMKNFREVNKNKNTIKVYEIAYSGVSEWIINIEYLIKKFERKTLYIRINKFSDFCKKYFTLYPETMRYYLDNDILFKVDAEFFKIIPLETINRIHYMIIYIFDDELKQENSETIFRQTDKFTFYIYSGLIDDGPIEFGFDRNKYADDVVVEFTNSTERKTVFTRVKRFFGG